MEVSLDKYNRKVYTLKTNNVIMNTIRRIIYQNIPVFAFDLIDIKKNTSIYNNDQMRLRISNFPVYGLENNSKVFEKFVEDNYELVINNNKEIETTKLKDDDNEAVYKNVDNKEKIIIEDNILTLVCLVKHESTTKEYLNVMTSDCKFFINNKEVADPYKVPLLICKLRYKEELDFTASTRMSIPIESPLWNCVSNCYFVEKSPELYNLIIESRGQISEEDIIKRCKFIIKEKLKHIQEIIKDKNIESEGILKIEHDKFTLPALLNFYLQEHEQIEYSGYRCEHLLNDTSIIYFKSANNAVIKIIVDTIKKIEKIIDKLIPI